MILHKFTMTDRFNNSIPTLISYVEPKMPETIAMMWGEDDIADIRIDSIEVEGLPVQVGDAIQYSMVVKGEITTKHEEMLNNLEKDCKTVLQHPNNNLDLLNMVLSEDVPELIKIARRVAKAFKDPLPDGTGQVHQGYCDAICSLRKEIYE